jgi:Zn-dependent protease/CBS domain-containing protein
MERRWQIATLGGVPIYVTPGWLLFVALIGWIFYGGLSRSSSLPDEEVIALSALAVVLFFGGVAVHEGAHALVARRFGLPVFGVTFVFWGGYTETPAGAKGALREFAVSIVGPLSTLAIALLLFVLRDVTSGETSEVVGRLAYLNLLFAGVNAIPALPLDGGHALTAAVRGLTGNRRTAERVTGYVSLGAGVALVAGGFVSLRNGGGWWLPMLFIGFQMISFGRGTEQRVALRTRLAEGRVADAMRPLADIVPAELSLSEALDRYLRAAPGRYFPVTEADRLIGTISLKTSKRIGSKDPLRPVRDATIPLEQSMTVDPGMSLDEAAERLAGRDGMVVEGGRLLGALGPTDIESWLRGELQRQPGPVHDAARGLPPRPDL